MKFNYITPIPNKHSSACTRIFALFRHSGTNESTNSIKFVAFLMIVTTGIIGSVIGQDLDSNRAKEISAREIMDEIQRGMPIQYDNVIINGDIKLSQLDLPIEGNKKLVYSPIKITNSQIKGSINFNDVIFDHQVELYHNIFNKDARFWGSEFNEKARFDNTIFNGYAGFLAVKFGKEAYFNGAKFKGVTSFWQSNFSGYADFRGAIFEDETYFWASDFDNDVTFKESQFDKNASFIGSRFYKFANFEDCRFKRDGLFNGSQFEGSANYNNAHFLGDALFSGVKFKGDAVYEGSTYGSRSQLDLTGAKFERFYANWDNIRDHLKFDRNIYNDLINNYENLKLYNDADDCYYDYRKSVQDLKPIGWSRAIDYILLITSGYGKRPWNSLISCSIIILLFGIIFYGGKGIEDIKAKQPPEADNDISLSDAICFSAILFIAKIPTDYRPIRRWKYLAIIEGILGWIFLAAIFSTTLSNVVK